MVDGQEAQAARNGLTRHGGGTFHSQPGSQAASRAASQAHLEALQLVKCQHTRASLQHPVALVQPAGRRSVGMAAVTNAASACWSVANALQCATLE